MAWNAPQGLISNLNFLINPVRKIFPHTNEYIFTIDTVNQGSKNNILTFQGPIQYICGIACFLSVILISDPTVKHSLISKGKLPDYLLWMAKIFNYSDFLRCVMIKFFQRILLWSEGVFMISLEIKSISNFYFYSKKPTSFDQKFYADLNDIFCFENFYSSYW